MQWAWQKVPHLWMVSGPEMARINEEFLASTDKVGMATDTKHHEESNPVQVSFAQVGSPFTENSSDLIVLDTRDIADPAIIELVRQIEKLGTDRCELYVQVEKTWWKRRALFHYPPFREHSKSQQQLSSLKNDCSSFSRLYVASHIRDGDMKKFFENENKGYSPSISYNGKLKTGNKADLLGLLEALVSSHNTGSSPKLMPLPLKGLLL